MSSLNALGAAGQPAPQQPRSEVTHMDLENDRLLRLGEVLVLCSVSKSFLYREIASGRFPPPVRIGRRATRWKAKDILAWMESRPQAEGALGDEILGSAATDEWRGGDARGPN